jgi:hypothetical protein
MGSPARGGIEEQALDRDQAPGLEDADQQSWKATRHRAAPHRAGGMEAHIGRQEGDATNVAEIALRQRAGDRRSLIPKALERRRPIIGRHGQSPLAKHRMAEHLADRPHHLAPIATGKAMDEDRLPPLSYRQAGRAILMGRAWHQRIAAIPAPAEALHNGERLSRGLIAHGKQS